MFIVSEFLAYRLEIRSDIFIAENTIIGIHFKNKTRNQLYVFLLERRILCVMKEFLSTINNRIMLGYGHLHQIKNIQEIM